MDKCNAEDTEMGSVIPKGELAAGLQATPSPNPLPGTGSEAAPESSRTPPSWSSLLKSLEEAFDEQLPREEATMCSRCSQLRI